MWDKSAYNASIRDIDMPDRIKKMPVSPRGFPVPWFVAFIDGVPDFRVIRENGVATAHRRKICWVCGEPMGVMKAMSLGPMCVVNRVISEPPSHRACAIYSCLACPFLSNPRMRRNSVDLPDAKQDPSGVHIERNPGAMAVWITRNYRPFETNGDGVGNAGVLFTFGDPEEILWFANGRPATRAEIMASIDSGFPLLVNAARMQDTHYRQGTLAYDNLMKQRERALKLLPVA
jgi:hypothetical protein